VSTAAPDTTGILAAVSTSIGSRPELRAAHQSSSCAGLFRRRLNRQRKGSHRVLIPFHLEAERTIVRDLP
jgi:hypothetical protein